MPKKTIAYQYIERTPPKKSCEFGISVEQQNCLILARSIIKKTGQTACILNLANQFEVGGNYFNISRNAQEESLIKRTDLLESLIQLEGIATDTIFNPSQYDLPDNVDFSTQLQRLGFGEFTCLYSPEITVQELEHELTTEELIPFKINVISSTAYNLANIEDFPKLKLDKIETIFRIISQLRVAKLHGQRHLIILDTFGYDAFHNTPKLIASIYHSVINEYEFQGCFESITFAMMTIGISDENYRDFIREFSLPSKSLSYEFLREGFKFLKTNNNQILAKMLAPFLEIKRVDEFIYLASRMLEQEINLSSNHSVVEKSEKNKFLQHVLETIKTQPKIARDIIDHLVSTKILENFYSNQLLFKTKPTIINKLDHLLKQMPNTIPFLSPTQIKLAEEFAEYYILAKAGELIACCESYEDKQCICYLLYVAAHKEQNALLLELSYRLKHQQYKPHADLLLAINDICFGKGKNEILTSITDMRFCAGRSQQKVAVNFGQYIMRKLDTLLQISYFDIVNIVEFEEAFELNSQVSTSLRPDS